MEKEKKTKKSKNEETVKQEEELKEPVAGEGMEDKEQEQAQEVTEPEKKDEWQDKYIRLCADFENYKKRTQKEMLSSYSNGVCAVIEALLPVVDNFDRAAENFEGDDSPLAQGISMIYKQLKEMLEKLEVTEIPGVGEKFDPNMHNAVMHVEDENFGENEIAEQFLKGYKVKEKVVRHSMVKVAN